MDDDFFPKWAHRAHGGLSACFSSTVWCLLGPSHWDHVFAGGFHKIVLSVVFVPVCLKRVVRVLLTRQVAL